MIPSLTPPSLHQYTLNVANPPLFDFFPFPHSSFLFTHIFREIEFICRIDSFEWSAIIIIHHTIIHSHTRRLHVHRHIYISHDTPTIENEERKRLARIQMDVHEICRPSNTILRRFRVRPAPLPLPLFLHGRSIGAKSPWSRALATRRCICRRRSKYPRRFIVLFSLSLSFSLFFST